MKKLLFAVSALAALSLLAPSAGFAQAYNQMGIYLDEEATTVNTTLETGLLDVYLVATMPYSHTADAPVTVIKGFECAIIIAGTATYLDAANTYPVPGLNVGNDRNMHYGFSAGAAVSGTSMVLCELHILKASAGTLTFHVAPADPASVDGMMAIIDFTTAPQTLVGMNPASGSFDDPVFAVNVDPGIVATEATTFDNIKAMYR